MSAYVTTLIIIIYLQICTKMRVENFSITNLLRLYSAALMYHGEVNMAEPYHVYK